ncbi:MAG: cysteine-rich repeat protein [Bradymonadia bacterium]|jgi:cysteine-rich repeat protein
MSILHRLPAVLIASALALASCSERGGRSGEASEVGSVLTDDAATPPDADTSSGVDASSDADTPPDADISSDVAPYCGDGVVDEREACDDGNTVENDYCSNACVVAACGDGVVQNPPPDIDLRLHFDDGAMPAELVLDGPWTVVRDPDESRPGRLLRSSLTALSSPTSVSLTSASSLGANFSFEARRFRDCCTPLRVFVNSVLQAEFEPTQERERHAVQVAAGRSEVRIEYDYGSPAGPIGAPVWLDDIRVRSLVMLTESCDDGDDNGYTPNACRPDCVLPSCGDGVVDEGESCDDGNALNDDGCSSVCEIERCGDGTVQHGEECDDGNALNDDGCSSVCEIERCGDGIVQPGEQCDDGNRHNNDACSTLCQPPRCGDELLQTHEACDDGNDVNTDACLNTCSEAGCGDGFVHHEREQCDDGNTDDNDGCSALCRAEFCGDGILQPGEICDDGNRDNEDACSNACAPPRCGDDELRTGGNLVPADYTFGGWPLPELDLSAWTVDGWSRQYFWDWATWFVSDELPPGGTASFSMPVQTPVRTNMRVHLALASSAPTDALSVYVDDQITLRVHDQPRFEELVIPLPAGESVVRFVYEVSDLPRQHPQFALISWIRIDRVSTALEECDDGPRNANAPSACRPDCRLPRCGDGIVDRGEQCDDGNVIEDDGCSHLCRVPGCGDGVLQEGEACDDGNLVDDDECTNACLRPVCGDGVRAGDEVCDGAPANVCTDECTLQRCGDGLVQSESLLYDEYYAFGGGGGSLRLHAGHERPETIRYGLHGGGQVVVAFDAEVFVQDEGFVVLRTASTTIPIGATGEAWRQPHGGDPPSRWEYTLPVGATWFEIRVEIGPVEAAWIDSDTSYAEIWVDNISIRSISAAAEECDDGLANALEADACRPYCRLPRCGDGVVDSGEQCDDGNSSNTDGCKRDCSLAVCGDGLVDASEACDDGNSSNTDGCTNACMQATCGDGYIGEWTQRRDVFPRMCTLSLAGVGPEPCELDCLCKDRGYEWSEGYQRGDRFGMTVYDGEFIEDRVCGEGVCGWSEDVRGTVCSGEDVILGVTCARQVVETCDDGNTADGDGCSASCQVE